MKNYFSNITKSILKEANNIVSYDEIKKILYYLGYQQEGGTNHDKWKNVEKGWITLTVGAHPFQPAEIIREIKKAIKLRQSETGKRVDVPLDYIRLLGNPKKEMSKQELLDKREELFGLGNNEENNLTEVNRFDKYNVSVMKDENDNFYLFKNGKPMFYGKYFASCDDYLNDGSDSLNAMDKDMNVYSLNLKYGTYNQTENRIHFKNIFMNMLKNM